MVGQDGVLHEVLSRTIELARRARDRGDHPFGAVVLTPTLQEVDGLNAVNSSSDITAHAELVAIREAWRQSSGQLHGAALFCSTEPCAMCCGAAFWAGISSVAYATSADE